jgi:aryl-alcohol dehydrogenase-like predicted oxidoreductase
MGALPFPAGDRAGIVLGCMNFGKRTPAAESERILARAIERGVVAFDTANVYNDGESERILGRALRGRRDRVAVATKVGLGRVAGKPEGLSPAAIHRAVDESLKRLGTDYVDVYYFHAPDHAVPVEESLQAMAELLDAGKIRAVGVSNYAAWQILEMMALSHARGLPRPAISQVMYNLLIRQIETEYVGFTRAHPIHTTVYNPLAGGLLTGRHRRSGETEAGSRFEKNRMYQGRYWSDRFFDLVEQYRALASDLGMSLVDLSYAWLAGAPGVSSILVGPGSIDHLDAAFAGVERALPQEARERVDAVHRAYLGTDASYVR